MTNSIEFIDPTYKPLSPQAAADVSEARDWGVSPGPHLWSTRLRILFVIDAHINLGREEWEFGLGQVLQTLRDPFAWWVRFDYDVAGRDGDQSTKVLTHPFNHWPSWPSLPSIFRKFKLYSGFRFTQSGFNLNDYHQVWFFGYWPGDAQDDDSNIHDQVFSPLEDGELKVVAEWMDRGGGVFATGDHGTLGASMCSRIPRVRTMRKWKHDQVVPKISGDTRHETLVHVPNVSEDEEERDIFPQRIQPVYRTISTAITFPFGHRLTPHPLLCSPHGVIDTFPDHMHEGEVIEDANVPLDKPLDIPGYNRPEYPRAVHEISLPAAAAGTTNFLDRPRPEVIAHGWTTNLGPTRVPPNGGIASSLIINRLDSSKRFALIGVYDGDRAEIGRVVVDSTWHHWFSYNLVGFQQANPAVYKKMQAYYRNVALWLATPGQRASMLSAAIWGTLTGLSPMAFRRGMGAWEIGERVVDVIGRTASQCILSELVGAVLESDPSRLSSVPHGLPRGQPCWSVVPVELINRAIVGGIGAALLDLALDYTDQRALGQRPLLDPDSIRRNSIAGAAEGRRLLATHLRKAAADITAVGTRLGDGLRSPPAKSIPIPVETVRLGIIAERLQIPDATDPALFDGRLSLTLRVRLDESVISSKTLERIRVPRFGPQGALIKLDHKLLETYAQTGQTMTVELLVGAWTLEEPGPEPLRFSYTLAGDPSTWLGRHTPDRAQSWRLWFRIEQVTDRPSRSKAGAPPQGHPKRQSRR